MRQGHGRLCASGRFARSMHLGLTVTQRGLAFLRIGAGSHHCWDAGTLVTQTCREGAKAPAHRRGREAGFWVTRCGASRLAGRCRGPRTRRVATATQRCACVSGGEGNVWRTVGAATLPPRASRRRVSRRSAANTSHGAQVILRGAGTPRGGGVQRERLRSPRSARAAAARAFPAGCAVSSGLSRGPVASGWRVRPRGEGATVFRPSRDLSPSPLCGEPRRRTARACRSVLDPQRFAAMVAECPRKRTSFRPQNQLSS